LNSYTQNNQKYPKEEDEMNYYIRIRDFNIMLQMINLQQQKEENMEVPPVTTITKAQNPNT